MAGPLVGGMPGGGGWPPPPESLRSLSRDEASLEPSCFVIPPQPPRPELEPQSESCCGVGAWVRVVVGGVTAVISPLELGS